MANQPLEPPPRLSGNDSSDLVALREYIWALYSNFVLSGGVVTNLTLGHGKVYIGNTSDLATPQSVSGDAIIGDTGAVTVESIQGIAISGVTGTVKLVLSKSPVLETPTLGVAAATSISFGDTALANYKEGTFTPTVTLVGGAGNTVPVYTTNSGRYTRIGNRVFVDVALLSDGGAEGAGTGQINIALPIAASASIPSFGLPKQSGYGQNGATYYELVGYIAPSATTITLSYAAIIGTLSDYTGALQNDTTRAIRLTFSYEV